MRFLYDFVFDDETKRFKAIVCGIFASFVCGITLDLGVGMELATASHAAAFIGFATFFLTLVAMSVWGNGPSLASAKHREGRRELSRRAVWSLSLSSIFLTLVPLSRRMIASTTSKQLLAFASNPSSRKSQELAVETLETARRSGIPLPKAVIKQAGDSFIRAARTEPGAWPAALDLMGYQTAIDDTKLPRLTPAEKKESVYYQFSALNNRPDPKAFHIESHRVPIEDSAVFEFIDKPLQQTSLVGNETLVIVGGSLLLDGMRLRHVIFKDTELHYEGGKLIIEDVRFLNCVFVFDNSKPSRELGAELFASSPLRLFRIGV